MPEEITAKSHFSENIKGMSIMDIFIKFGNILNKISEGLLLSEDVQGIIYVNPFMLDFLGRSREEMLGSKFNDFISPEYGNITEDLTGSSDIEFELECIHKNGTKLPVKIKAELVITDNKKISILAVEDLHERRKYRQALRESGEKFRKMIRLSSEVISLIDSEGFFEYNSDSIERIFGYSPYEIAGRNVLDFVHPDDRDSMEKNIVRKRNGKTGISGNSYRLRHKNGTWRHVSTTGNNMIDDPLVGGIVLHTRDVTDQKTAEEKAARHQLYDTEITDLPKLGYLKNRLQLEILKVEERNIDNKFALMSIGIDKFKNINNLYGKSAGDKILNRAAKRIKETFREDDLVSRFNSDVFIILLTYVARSFDLKDIVRKAQKIFSEPFVINDRRIKVTASIGIALYPHDGREPEVLINNSESAMYRAKEAGPDQYCLFDMTMHEELINNLHMEEELKEAVQNDEFAAYYQSKFNSDFEVVSIESLIRWESPARGVIPPGKFIPLLEKNGMIIDVGYIILRKVCEQIKKWEKADYRKPIAVNFAPAQFKDPHLIENIKKIIDETGVDTDLLEFEITESGIIENAKEALMKLFKIRSMGVTIAMDDFGTGLSSLSNLINYPIDVIKIDKSFVDKLPNNEEAKIVVDSIINLAENLGYKVVAEGIENINQLEYLKKKNCKIFQGYYHSKPLSADDFEKRFIFSDSG